MKTSLKLTLAFAAVATFLFVGTNQANAQQKFGYINSQELIASMPESDSLKSKMADLSKELESQFTTMRNEMVTKTQDYQNSLSTLSEAIRKQKEKDLYDLQSRLEEFQQSAQEELQSKQMELLKPIMEKAQGAVSKVAKEQALVCVFDLATGALAYYNDAAMVNVLPLAKKTLGITK